LTHCAASPIQRRIYVFVKEYFIETGLPVKNGDIAKKIKRFRTTVTFHLQNMVEKGLLNRHGKHYYTPVLSLSLNPSMKGSAMSTKTKTAPKKAAKPAAKKAVAKPAKKTAPAKKAKK
jgi:hypothetical protein